MTHVASKMNNIRVKRILSDLNFYIFNKIKTNINKNNNSKLTDTECSGSVSKMMQ